jgi:hypothetical protein
MDPAGSACAVLRSAASGASFTYDAFADTETLPLPGPVFIHEESCTRYPEDGGFPDELRAHALTLEAYGRGRQLRAVERVGDGAPGRVEESIERLLARPDVDYTHVRDTAAGCYDCRIERAEAGAGARAARVGAGGLVDGGGATVAR